MEVWEICEEIAGKHEWYHKVFDQIIVEKWRKESKNDANFSLALSLVQASAKGTKINKDCCWEEGLCPECVRECKEHLMHSPEDIHFDDDDDNDLTNEKRIAKFFADPDWESSDCIYNMLDHQQCEHIRCKCVSPDCELSDYICYHPDGLLNNDLHNQLKELINKMNSQEIVDWHPNSNEQVRDLIHPSLFCFCTGKSVFNDGTVKGKYNDELTDYQWLPAEFEVKDNRVKINSYINNLDEQKYPEFVPLIEEVFAQYLPNLETVMNKKLNNRTLQVIVKVGSIILNKDKNKYGGGSYHLEGIVDERIIATAIHYIESKEITDSFLEFRKPTIINEENLEYPQSDANFTQHHYGITDHFDGTMNKYLGMIKCHENADVIFPNNLQHRVKEFELDGEEGLRTILCFFIVDPDHRIISTKDIPKQQNVMSLEDAKFYRERLMFHRKYYVDQFNQKVMELPVNLCEH